LKKKKLNRGLVFLEEPQRKSGGGPHQRKISLGVNKNPFRERKDHQKKLGGIPLKVKKKKTE